MCGISCCIGENAAARAVEGLQKLTYRGYDSAGIAVVANGKLHVRRCVGKLDRLLELLALHPLPSSYTCISHVRWATHGAATENNCHPHIYKNVAVVANGTLKSPTTPDTAIIPILISNWMSQYLDLRTAAKLAADQLEGVFCFAAISSDEPGTIAIEDRGIEMYSTVDGLITSAVVESGELREATWTYQEIKEQPEILSRDCWSGLYIRPDRKTAIVGCGSSRHAALAAGLNAVVASEYRPGDEDLFVGISQSGETADVIAALRRAKGAGKSTVGVCNVEGSALVREADERLLLNCGPERGVAATKSFTGMISTLWGRHEKVAINLPAIEVSAKKVAEKIWREKMVILIGRGRHYALALEGALKLQELAYVPALAFVASELRHGPLALVEDGTPVICLGGSTAAEAKARGAQLFSSPFTGESLSEILSEAIWLQLIAVNVAMQLGRDIDQPRNLAKSVTTL